MTTTFKTTKNFTKVAEAMIMAYEAEHGKQWHIGRFEQTPLLMGNVQYSLDGDKLIAKNVIDGGDVPDELISHDVACMLAALTGQSQLDINGKTVAVEFNRRSLYWTLAKYVGYVIAGLIVIGGAYYAYTCYRDS